MNLEKLKKLVQEACGDYDAHQKQQQGFGGEKKASGGKMARTDLVTIAKDAQELVNMFGDDAELPDWVESKLTKAADYLNSVKKYIGGEIVRQQGGLMEAGFYRNPDEDEIDSGIGKKALGITPEFEKMRKDARREKQLQGALVGDISLLKYREGGATPRRIKALIRKYKKKAEQEGIQFTVPDFADVLSEKVYPEPIEEQREVYLYIEDATYDDGSIVEEDFEFWSDVIEEAEYRGRKVKLNKPMRGDVKKFKVFVKDPKTGNVKKVNYGDPNMRIKKSSPKRRKSFRARHNCDNPGPKTKARYWSCRKW